MIHIVLISDTHGMHGMFPIPDGDILIHAGDVSGRGSKVECEHFIKWFSEQPHEHKVFIAGNHDFYFEHNKPEIPDGVTYLQDSGTEIRGLKIWGSPITPRFYNWAFMRDRGDEISMHWEMIPDDTDILITHGPPKGIGDNVLSGERVGCDDLRARLEEISPRLHVFGHIHEGYGEYDLDGIRVFNASVLNERYHQVNDPVVINLEVNQ